MRARLLDLTRLVSRLGREALTGVDRVELAWAERLLEGEAREGIPLFALVRTAWGFCLLDGRGAARIVDMAHGTPLGPADLAGRIGRRRDPLRAQAEAEARRAAIAHCLIPGLKRMLRRHLPDGCACFNMGHANLTPQVMAALPGHLTVLVHDTIPLDHPEFTRPGIPETFARKMAAVSGRADLVVHSTQAARRLTEEHFARMGRVPPGLVAPLGITSAPPVPVDPPGLDRTRPFFVILGTIEPRKNHDLLLDVWDRLALQHPPGTLPQLLIAGSRGWRNHTVFQRLDARPDGIIEASGLSDGALTNLMQRSAGLLLPSHAEGYGLPPLEAASLGVPVIVSDLPVFRETLGDYAVYLDRTDVYSWMETIGRLAASHKPEEECASGKAARQAPLGVPGWESHFNAVLNIICQVGGGNRPE
ncbi:glycosyltransferase family 4 protein [Gemmobacter serpentinus]|uniref:glycosyltransferase family 4 protein n=1 Tax=Gemmobacter serpentinus TaxID=2652247 RepID=UPI00124EF98C|nr:glycosyltransferase family 1 protein [Gemmobacter serpentinus]